MKDPEKMDSMEVNYRMIMGNDYKFHFCDPVLRRKAGDDYEFTGTEPEADSYMPKQMVSKGKPV